MKNKLIIVIVVIITVVGVFLLVLNNYHLNPANIPQVQQVPVTGSGRHLSVNLVENMQINQGP